VIAPGTPLEAQAATTVLDTELRAARRRVHHVAEHLDPATTPEGVVDAVLDARHALDAALSVLADHSLGLS
jgi:hypothetical protein